MFTPAWAAEFHNYTLLWSRRRMDFFLDGAHMQSIDLEDDIIDAHPMNPFTFGTGQACSQLLSQNS